jgi:hypothetical protein
MRDCQCNGVKSEGTAVRLTDMRLGQVGVVQRSSLAVEDAALLSAMGLCCNARVRMCRLGQPCIVAISGRHGAECRIGLARPLAERIVVDLC